MQPHLPIAVEVDRDRPTRTITPAQLRDEMGVAEYFDRDGAPRMRD